MSPASIEASAARLRERGWLGDDGAITDDGRHRRDEVEAMTDASQRGLMNALGSGLDDVLAAGRILGEAILAARAAPADPRKRAAG